MTNHFESDRSLRSVVLEHYISTSNAVHCLATADQIDSYVRAYLQYLRPWLPERPKGKWLDLGCGQGGLMCLAREHGYSEVEGSDLSPEMLTTARANGLNVRKEDVFATVARTAPDSCAVISCFDLLEHFPKDEGFKLLVSIHRILKPNGMLLLKLPNAYSPWGMGITADDLTHEAAYTDSSLRQLASLAGFTNGEVREVGPLPHSARGVIRCFLWAALRRGLKLADLVEAGRTRTSVYTRVMLGRFVK